MQAFTPGDLPELAPHPGYRLVLPDHPRPIVLIGAGGIVRDAHLPAYAKAGFTVASLTNNIEPVVSQCLYDVETNKRFIFCHDHSSCGVLFGHINTLLPSQMI